MSLAEADKSGYWRPNANLRAVLDRGIFHRHHVHVIPATFATLGLGAVMGHEVMYGFASDSVGQVGGDLAGCQVLAALHITEWIP